jgi:hypothetical protein
MIGVDVECELPVVFVDVEHAPCARAFAEVSLVHRRSNAVNWRTRANVRPRTPAPMIEIEVFEVITSLASTDSYGTSFQILNWLTAPLSGSLGKCRVHRATKPRSPHCQFFDALHS